MHLLFMLSVVWGQGRSKPNINELVAVRRASDAVSNKQCGPLDPSHYKMGFITLCFDFNHFWALSFQSVLIFAFSTSSHSVVFQCAIHYPDVLKIYINKFIFLN